MSGGGGKPRRWGVRSTRRRRSEAGRVADLVSHRYEAWMAVLSDPDAKAETIAKRAEAYQEAKQAQRRAWKREN